MITTSRVSILCALFAGFANTAWARPTPDAQATCTAILSRVNGAGRASPFMINQAIGTMREEVERGEANESTWRYPQITLGVGERAFSLNVDSTTAKLESKRVALARWEEVAQNLGTLKPGQVAFSQMIEGREPIAKFFATIGEDIEALNARVEPVLARKKFWDAQRKMLTGLRSVVPAGALLIAGGGATLITGTDMTEAHNAVGAGFIWLSTLGARDLADTLPWWAAAVSKSAQRYLDERSAYRTLHFSDGMATMVESVENAVPGWRSVHLVVPVAERLAQEIIDGREGESDNPDYDPLALKAELTINSIRSNRDMRTKNLRWATVDLFLSVSDKGVPTLVIAGSLQKDFILAPKKKQKSRREAPVLQDDFGMVPQLIPVRVR